MLQAECESSTLPGNARFTLLVYAVLLLTATPYAFAYRNTPSGWHLMGILLNVPDNTQDLSWAHESTKSLLIQDKFTSELGRAVYYNLFFLAVGHLARVLHFGYAEALQVARSVAGATYMGAIFWFTGLAFSDRRKRWSAALVALLGAGLGWMGVVTKVTSNATQVPVPIDVYTSEPNTFPSVLAFPLQAMAGGLIVMVLGLAALAYERDSIRLATLAGGLALLLALQHTHDLLVLYAVAGSLAAVLWIRAAWLRGRIRYDVKDVSAKFVRVGLVLQSSRCMNLIGAVAWLMNGQILRLQVVATEQLRPFDALVRLITTVDRAFRWPFGLSVLATGMAPAASTDEKPNWTGPSRNAVDHTAFDRSAIAACAD